MDYNQGLFINRSCLSQSSTLVEAATRKDGTDKI